MQNFMKNSPLLSICIPSYNRADLLAECLRSILLSAKGYEEQLEIIVADNASTDHTRDVVVSFQKKFPQLIYFRHESNIGGERNFRHVASMATGEYIWVCGDDDRIAVLAIEHVINRIQASFDLIVCNYSMWTKDFSACINPAVLDKADRIFTDKNDLLATLGLNVGYISSVIIRKSLFFKLPAEEYESYVDFGFPFVYAVYSGMQKSCKAIYLAEPLILNRTANTGAYDWYKYFVVGSSLIFNELYARDYASASIDTAKKKVIRQYVIHDLLVKKRDGVALAKYVRLMFRYYRSYALFWGVILPIFLIPPKLVWLAWWSVKKLKNIKHSIGAPKGI
jgi:abequosyltransferase